MTTPCRVMRLSEDSEGESHFDEVEVEQTLSKFAPPALPFLVSQTESARGYATITIPAGWVGERHPSPHRQICFCWSGALKVTASDGEVQVIEAGKSWLMTDTDGKGHESEVVSSIPFEAVLIFLPSSN